MDLGRKSTFLKSSVAGVALATVVALLCVIGPTQGAAQTAKGKQLLDELIAKVKKEGALDAAGISTLAPRKDLVIRAFLNRFGLKINFNFDVAGEESAEWSKMHASLAAGVPAEFDVYVGDDVKAEIALQAKRLQPVDNWQDLLAAVNPDVAAGRVKPNQVSFGPFEGYGFVFQGRVYGGLYNSKLISEKDRPRKLIDLANPKYKGKFPIAPFPTMWQYGPFVYPNKDEWLKIVGQIGQNAGAVLTFDAGSERVYLGEFALMPLATQSFYRVRDKDPKSPLRVWWPEDYVAMNDVLHAVPIRSRHPAGATLFTLWMTTPEALEIWQPELWNPNLRYPRSAFDNEVAKEVEGIKKKGGKVVSWFDNAQSKALLDWYGTKEGAEYRRKIVQAITQRK